MKTSNIFLSLAALLLVAASVMAYRHGKLTLQIAMADEQVKIFEAMRIKALASPPLEAAKCLLYVQNYYPSGSKQVAGSRLDRIVEAARAGAIREVTSYLRSETSEDLGSDPSKWIELLETK